METYCKPNFDTTFTLREQPAGLCSTCRWYLFACNRGQNWDEVRKPSPRSRWDAFEMEHGRFKESAHDPDVCQVCLLAKWNPVGEPERNADKRYIMKSIIEPVPAERSYKFCDKCYQYIDRGIPHPCTLYTGLCKEKFGQHCCTVAREFPGTSCFVVSQNPCKYKRG